MSRKRTVDLAIAIVALLVVIIAIALRASVNEEQTSVPSTYDTGLHGYAALYEELAREGVPVQRSGAPLSQLSRERGILVIAGDDAFLLVAQGGSQTRALDAWVRSGATLAIFGSVPRWFRAPLGLPASVTMNAATADSGCGLRTRVQVAGNFALGMTNGCTRDRVTLLQAHGRAVAIAYRRGNGTILFAPTPTLFDNEHLAQRANARFAYELLSRGGPVRFDERIYGYAEKIGFWQVLPMPMRVAIILAAGVVVLAIIGANLPFAPPRVLQDAQERDSSEYIASLARMLQRGGADREIVQRLCAHVRQVLAARTSSDEEARTLVDRARALQSLLRPTADDVLAAGRLFARVQKDYEW